MPPPPLQNIAVLLLEDDDEAARALSHACRPWGWRLERAASVDEALRVQGRCRGLLAGPSFGAEALAALQGALSAGLKADESAPFMVRMVSGFGSMAQPLQGGLAHAAVLHCPVTRAGLLAAVLQALQNAPMVKAAEPGTPAQAPAARQEPPAGGTAPGMELAGMSLLLVEDNMLNQVVASTMLQGAGASVDIASNGQEAVDALRREGARYDVVLMDVQMPVLDGFAATRAIRNELGLRTTIIAMTAGVTQAEQAQCIAAGMDDFIAKPVECDEMIATIARYR
jgi:CheY-like chemotaxis protein